MSGYLLDTHAALWWWTDLARLGRDARHLIETTRDPLRVSAVSAYEISLKWQRGQLPHIGDPDQHYIRLMTENGFVEVPVETGHALRAGSLVSDHRDPFDRIIAAQALSEELIVITRDPAIAGFGCKTLW